MWQFFFQAILAQLPKAPFMGFLQDIRVAVSNKYQYSVHKINGSEVRRMNFQRQGGGRMFTNNVFPGVFDDAAQQAYMESTETYTRLFDDSEKYHAIMSALHV